MPATTAGLTPGEENLLAYLLQKVIKGGLKLSPQLFEVLTNVLVTTAIEVLVMRQSSLFYIVLMLKL